MNANVRMPLEARATTEVDEGQLEVVVCRTLPDLMQAMAVRTLVYIGEQACPYDEEYDGNDFAGATHLILRRDGEPIGTLRIRWFADFAKVERVAVRKEYRRGRATLMLILAAKRLAEKKNYRQILGYGQVRLIPFWEQYFNARIRESREGFVVSDHDYVEMVVEGVPPADALTLDSDPLVLLRPEGAWDEVGVLDRSRARPASNLGELSR
ncbi:MAG: GNAT family N-acetyltransferase [Pseudomonadota bacterium]|uniref:GNAT family N-acetyltransferase n=1 Tax=unclassified Phenylobacterium TaxID=2640670 RepID=UPI000A4B3CB1|nr:MULTISPECIES: GNAT family N-acetyltransferase [unclassified Phenylobacterium]